MLGNVPPGSDMPLIRQNGKWRRQLQEFPTVVACRDNVLPDQLADLTNPGEYYLSGKGFLNANQENIGAFALRGLSCRPPEPTTWARCLLAYRHPMLRTF